jgi:hypothetical protein
VFALVLAYIALVAAYFALRTLSKLRRTTANLHVDRVSRRDLVRESASSNAAVSEQLEALRIEMDTTRTEVLSKMQAALRASTGAGALRNVALVRYDAFPDMAGRLSFSLALLDSRGDGVALSSISGHSDTRVYAKGISNGKGEHELSPEEKQAVSAALHRPRTGLLNRKAS